MLFFGKKRKKEQEIDEAFAKVYQEIETIDNWNDPKKLEHYILDSCEQIIALTKEIEGEKTEYRIVTSYLTDIQTIEGLPEEMRQSIREAATNIEQLNAARQAYEKATYQISEEQFMLMEQEEDDIPQTIHRLLDNERYQDKVRRDKNILEAQKNQWEIEREAITGERKILKRASVLLFLLYVTLLILLFVLQFMAKMDLTVGFLVLFFVGALGGAMIYFRSLYLQKQMRQATRNENQAISLLNVVCMKYVNVTKAVEYTKDKFGIHNSTELNYVWEQYTSAVREKEKFLRNNDDLEYFNGRLIRLLQRIDLYDRKIWLTQTKALIDDQEMVEIKHNLVKRRQKIRAHMEENRKIVQSERNEIDRLMTEHEHYVPEIIEIISSVDKLCGLDEK
ncbi:MAG: hypothetical protein UEY91_08665 [Lachnospiraceae bacterium]|nr:hypothetical protein [Lachnospiraceae bacterium]